MLLRCMHSLVVSCCMYQVNVADFCNQSDHCRQCVRQETVAQYAAMVADLERSLPLSTSAPGRQPAAADVLQALPSALSNLHDFFIHVAARLERVHERLADAKEAYLAERAAVRIQMFAGVCVHLQYCSQFVPMSLYVPGAI